MDQGNEMSDFRMVCGAWDDVIELQVEGDVVWFTTTDGINEDASVASKLTRAELEKLRDALIAIAPLEEKVVEKKRKAPHGPQEYKGNGKHQWEQVDPYTSRLRVPSGWLYEHGCTITFVPLPAAVGYAV
jgi:hypothetical protein